MNICTDKERILLDSIKNGPDIMGESTSKLLIEIREGDDEEVSRLAIMRLARLKTK